MRRCLAVLAAGFTLVVSACGGPSTSAPGCTIGVSWNNYQEERWAKWDEPAIQAALAEGGASYVSNDAKSSAETQASNVENLISQGAQVAPGQLLGLIGATGLVTGPHLHWEVIVRGIEVDGLDWLNGAEYGL